MSPIPSQPLSHTLPRAAVVMLSAPVLALAVGCSSATSSTPAPTTPEVPAVPSAIPSATGDAAAQVKALCDELKQLSQQEPKGGEAWAAAVPELTARAQEISTSVPQDSPLLKRLGKCLGKVEQRTEN